MTLLQVHVVTASAWLGLVAAEVQAFTRKIAATGFAIPFGLAALALALYGA
jgi:hypothetical protein